MRIALAQINVTVGDLQGNQEKIIDFINRAKAVQADVVIFPELAVTGYPPEDLLHKKHFIDRNIDVIKAVSKEAKGIAVVLGYVDRDRRHQIFNAAAVMADGKTRGVYHKGELPNYSVFDEKRYFMPDPSDILFDIEETRLGLSICEDIWVDNGIYMKQAQQGAQVLVNISCSPYQVGKIKERDKMLAKRAQDADVYMVYVNLVGGQDELVFDGSSVVFDPKGKAVASAVPFAEDFVCVDIDTAAIQKEKEQENVHVVNVPHKSQKTKPLPPAKLKRLKLVEEVYCALILGTRDYVAKNGFEKVVIGLSGGVDSALVAAIACDAIGAHNVVGVTMPSKYTSKGTLTDAKKLAQNLGMELMEIPIGKTFQGFLKDLAPAFKEAKPNVTEENIQARIRGTLLMALSNKFDWLVLTTGNKSEMAVGYCTLYGDMSGGFAVIKDILKTKVYKLCAFRNQLDNQEIIPSSILKRPPSAELRDDQKDQDSLPPYEVLDKILVEYIEKHEALRHILKVVADKALVQRVIGLVDRSEYKRRQSPPGIKITSRSFGKDWRLPITNRYRPH